MYHSGTRQRFLSLTICLLFLGIPALGFISADFAEVELEEDKDDSLTHSGSTLHAPGSQRGLVFSESVFELNSGAAKMVLENGSTVEFSSGNAVYSNGSVISTAGDCAILSNYTLYCDGLNNYGQLGLGNNQLSAGYVDLGGSIPAAISDGNSHYCAITDLGSVKCWGRNHKGQIGDGTNINRNTPTSVDLGANKTAVAISAGRDFTCALLNTGDVSCWGDNSYGVLADGSTTDSNTPVLVNHSTGTRAVSITTPGFSVCAIFEAGSISCWGKSYTTSAANGAVTNGSVQIALAASRSAIAIDGINEHTCAILDNGSANCWGVNTYGQFGNGECSSVIAGSGCTGSNGNTPIEVNFTAAGVSASVIAISAGSDSTCAVMSNDSVYCWGNQNGEFDGTTDEMLLPHHMSFSNGADISFTDQDFDGDGIYNILDVHMAGDDDGDGIPSPTDPYPSNPARWQNCGDGSWGRITCTEASPGHYADGGALYHQECTIGTFQPQSGQTSCLDASAGHYVDRTASSMQYLCAEGYYQVNIGQTGCTISDSGSYVPLTGGEASDTSSGAINLSAMSATYTASIESASDSADYFAISVPRRTGISVNVSSTTGAEVDLILYNDTLSTIDSSNNTGMYDQVDSNSTNSNEDRDFYIAVTRVNGSGDYTFIVWFFDTTDDSLTGSTTLTMNAEARANQFLCDAGTYQPNNGSSSCDLADAGNFVSSTGATAQTPCSAGTYQPNYGQTGCNTASLGHYVPTSGQAYQTPADAGYFVATLGATQQTACSAGTYQPLTGQYDCDDADAGYYVADSGSAAQTACDPGTYQPNTGQTFCLNAAAGHYVPGSAATNQIECAPGSYQPTGGQSSCLFASAGYYVISNASTTQSPCVPGTYQPNTGQTRCLNADTGYYVDSNASAFQIACDVGTFQPNIGSIGCLVADPGHYVSVTASPSQTPCPTGTYNPLSGSTSSAACMDADLGHYVANSGSASQNECGIGTYQDLTGQASCQDADAGYFVNTTAAESQIPCSAGTFQPQAAQAGCYDADPGNYVENEGSALQTPCSAGTYNPLNGSSLPSDCLQSTSGHYVADSGAAEQSECQVGTYQPNLGRTSCIDAPAGTYVSVMGQSGYIECPVGRYQPSTGQTSCLNAEAGHFVSGTMATMQEICEAGTYQPLEEQTSCIEADAGYHVSIEGASEQTINPVDFYTDSPGSSYLTGCPNMYITLAEGAESIDDCVLDTDGDRTIDEDDPDDDGDGRMDIIDDCSPGLTGWTSNAATDFDGDGCKDEGEDDDDDNDGVEDWNDPFPMDNLEWLDTDGDTVGNNADTDDDGDGWDDSTEGICGSDSLDASNSPLDSDEDGTCDESDTDDDGDGYPDFSDWAPLDSTEWVDTDGDDIGNNADVDDDNDGWTDETEIEQGTNPLFADSDNDGVIDPEDAFPNNVKESVDSDGDGVGDNSDSHPNNARYQTTFDLLLDIVAGLALLVVIGAGAVIALRRKSSDSKEEAEANEEEVHIGVGPMDLEPMEPLGVSTITDSGVGEGYTEDVVEEDPIVQQFSEPEPEPVEEVDVGNMAEIDDLLSELPSPPKPVISPPLGTPVNEHGQQVWADATGQVWCKNMDGTILKHDAATGGWITYHG